MKKTKEVNAKDLKAALWDTLQKVKSKKLQPIIANAVARQASEIMRVVKAEVDIARLSGNKPSTDLQNNFTSSKTKALTHGRS